MTSKKLVAKAAESVWAANKYLVLACGQQKHREIRKLLRPDRRQIVTAYDQLAQVDRNFRPMCSEALPELSNALFHVLSYFKRILPAAKRQ